MKPGIPSRARHDLPLLMSIASAAIGLGAFIALLPQATVVKGVVMGVGSILIIGLALSTVSGSLAKIRTFIAGLQWWHWLWLLVFLSGLVFRTRDIEAIQDTPLDAWAAWRIGLMGIVAVVLLSRLASGRNDWVPGMARGLPAGIFLLGLTSLISTLWSVYPLWTLYKSIEYLIDVALLVGVVTAVRRVEDLKSLFDWTWCLYGLLLLTVWLGLLVRPDLALAEGIGLIGVQILGVLPAISANGVGDLGALLLIIASTRLLLRQTDRSVYWLLFLAALPTLIFAQSRSPATGALLGILAVLLVERRLGLLLGVAIAGAVFTALTSAEAVVQQAFLRGQSPELFYSLSGRVGWWTAGWEAFIDHPFLGLGGYAGARFAVLGSLGVTDSSSIHNAWLELVLGVGLIGFVPFIVAFLGTWSNLLRPLAHPTRSAVRELRAEAVGIFVLICFRSVFSVEFIWHPPLAFFVVLGCAELLRRTRREGIEAHRSAPAAWRRSEPIRLRGVAASVTEPLRHSVDRP